MHAVVRTGLALLAAVASGLGMATDAGGIVLRNAGEMAVTLEVQVPGAGECGAPEAPVLRQALKPGRSWRVGAESVVCWRVERGVWARVSASAEFPVLDVH